MIEKKPQIRPPKDSFKKEETSWGNVAPWYDQSVESGGSYQRELILPNLMRLLNLKQGEKVLDLACGQGLFAREIKNAGAEVVGSDISSELIALAKERSKGAGIEYFVSPAESQNNLADESFDKVVCVMALQDMEDLTSVMKEVGRILKKNGTFYAVINHPTFRIPKRSSWGYDDKNNIQYRRVDEYMSESRVKIDVHPGGKSGEATSYFHRPLQSYFKAFEKAGLAVARMEEWVSGRVSEPGPRALAENKSRKEFPLFMALAVRKL